MMAILKWSWWRWSLSWCGVSDHQIWIVLPLLASKHSPHCSSSHTFDGEHDDHTTDSVNTAVNTQPVIISYQTKQITCSNWNSTLRQSTAITLVHCFALVPILLSWSRLYFPPSRESAAHLDDHSSALCWILLSVYFTPLCVLFWDALRSFLQQCTHSGMLQTTPD